MAIAGPLIAAPGFISHIMSYHISESTRERDGRIFITNKIKAARFVKGKWGKLKSIIMMKKKSIHFPPFAL